MIGTTPYILKRSKSWVPFRAHGPFTNIARDKCCHCLHINWSLCYFISFPTALLSLIITRGCMAWLLLSLMVCCPLSVNNKGTKVNFFTIENVFHWCFVSLLFSIILYLVNKLKQIKYFLGCSRRIRSLIIFVLQFWDQIFR